MRQNKLRLYVHLVWATWDRVPLITDAIERELFRYISGVCAKQQCEVLAINGMPDHVHLLITLPPTLRLSDLVEQIKGGSSRYVTEQLKQGGWFKWQGNYGAFSVSPRDKALIIAYITNQKQHHAEGSLWASVEEGYITLPARPTDEPPQTE